jgi:two-component system, NtrC family, nitrogen regulation sensor histidine kinase NtrY
MSRFEVKIVAALLLIAVIPLGTSVVLVRQIIETSDRVSEGEERRLSQPLERAAEAYRALFAARKQVFRLQAQLLAQDPELGRALAAGEDQGPDPEVLARRLRELLGRQQELFEASVVRGDEPLARAARPPPRPAEAYRDLRLELPVGARGAGAGSPRLRLTFFPPVRPFEDFRALGAAQSATTHLARIRDRLAVAYRVSFFIIFGGVLLVATVLGLIIARRTARRVAVLAAATRKVARGDLETRVELHTKDELGDLADAFNDMVSQVRESRERIAYLEKIGAWQEIARRLAHEIKNPLTPIQLAMQQIHQAYRGEDESFRRTLDDARDIITEEVDGLRRLVGEFSAFAKLPSVQPEPLDLNGLVDDFLKSHSDLEQTARLLWQPVEPPIQVLVDRMLFKHVLFNLVENAQQAAEEAGVTGRLQVSFSARSEPAHQRCVFSIADTGPGMEAQTLAKIFDPYFTTKERGTGLGLAIVKKIILEHNGRIAVWSQPGEGSRFDISLPLVGERPDPAGGD